MGGGDAGSGLMVVALNAACAWGGRDVRRPPERRTLAVDDAGEPMQNRCRSTSRHSRTCDGGEETNLKARELTFMALSSVAARNVVRPGSVSSAP